MNNLKILDYTKEKYMWKTVEYSKNQIDKAGQLIINETISSEERQKCLEIIDNWRASHAFPMNTFTINLKDKTSKINGTIVVQRLKRLDTILDKLKRMPNMQLSRMQDIGGCRVVLKTIEEVYSVRQAIIESRIRHKLHNEKDYIKNPNPDTGYRGIHLIYKYKSDINDKYNGHFIEIQLRTRLQHLWATTVETVGMLTQNGLKFNQGEKDWLRFFELVSKIFEVKEMNVLKDVNSVKQYLKIHSELFDIMEKLEVVKKMYDFATASIIYNRVNTKSKRRLEKGYYLIQFNEKTWEVKISFYEKNEKAANRAIEDYMKVEAEKKTEINVVLVSAESMRKLKIAYPNYFADVKSFYNTLYDILEEQNQICMNILGEK